MVPACPDAELILPPGNFIVAARAWVLLQFEDHPGDLQEGVVIQFEELALGGAPEADLTRIIHHEEHEGHEEMAWTGSSHTIPLPFFRLGDCTLENARIESLCVSPS